MREQMKTINRLRKVLWNLIFMIGMFGYIYFSIKKDTHAAQFMLVVALISDNRTDIIELQERIK